MFDSQHLYKKRNRIQRITDVELGGNKRSFLTVGLGLRRPQEGASHRHFLERATAPSVSLFLLHNIITPSGWFNNTIQLRKKADHERVCQVSEFNPEQAKCANKAFYKGRTSVYLSWKSRKKQEQADVHSNCYKIRRQKK